MAGSGEGLRLRVRLTPRGGRDRVDGFAPDASGERVLRVRVAASPVDGAANAALVRLLSKVLGVPKAGVTIVSGATSRDKTVAVVGDPAKLAKRVGEIG